MFTGKLTKCDESGQVEQNKRKFEEQFGEL